MCSSWCPLLGPSVGSALPSTGSSEVSSPASTVLWRCATPCAPRAGLGCLRPTLPCVAPVVSLPAVQVAQPRAWGSSPGPHCRENTQGGYSGPPRFPRNPCVPTPCSPTPAGPTRQAIRRYRHGPRDVHDEGSHDNPLSGINHTALALAVYASSRALLHTTQDLLPAVGHFAGRDWLPAGFQ